MMLKKLAHKKISLKDENDSKVVRKER